MALKISLQTVLALITGIPIFVFSHLLNDVVAIYLIFLGITGLAQ